MTSFYLTPDARDDIADIWEFIAQDSVAAADRVEQAIFDACERIGSSPGIGHRRSDITALPVRFWTIPKYPNYMIVYREDSSPSLILAVTHGRRQIDWLLSRRDRTDSGPGA